MQRIGGGHDAGDRLVDRPQHIFLLALVGGLLLLLGSALVLLTLSPTHRESFSDVVSVPFAALAAATCGLRARRTVARARLAWGLLAAACVSWTLAETVWAVWSRRPDGPPIPLLDDAFYLLGMPLGILALAVLPGSHWRGADRLRSILDGLIIGSAMLFVFRGLGLLVRSEGALVDRVVNLSYPVGDLIMLTMALTLLMRATRATSTHVLLLAAAEASYVVGDSFYAIQVSQDRYRPGTWVDLTWLASYLLLALAAAAPVTDHQVTEGAPAPYEQQVTPWPLLGLALLAAAAVATFGPVQLTGDWVMVGSGFVVVLLFAARQGWLAYDVGRLNRALYHEMQYTVQIGQAVLDGVIVADPAGIVISGNVAAGQLLGRTAPSLTGLSIYDLLEPAPHGDPSSAADVVSAIRAGTPVTGAETAFRLDGGGLLPVEVTVGPLVQGDHPTGVVVVFRDVSARQAVDRLKQEFLSVVSHELRTPLASIRGALGLLHGGVGDGVGRLGPHGARMVDIALLSSERLSRLLDDILDIERLARGRLHLELTAHRADDLVAEAVNEMNALAAQQEVRLRVDATPGTVTADRDRIVQVLTNLVHNAIKFSACHADVVVSTRIVDTHVEFSVADQGRGIPADKLERIFEPFEQIDSSDSRPINGSGLGLAICRDLVRLHGGHIWATATLGVGSQFRFTLPIALAPAAPAQQQPPAPIPIAVAS